MSDYEVGNQGYGERIIECPYCRHEHDADCDDYVESERDFECYGCDKSFIVTGEPSFNFTTSQNCKVNEEEHDYTTNPDEMRNAGKEGHNDTIYHICKKCGDSKFE